VVVKVQYPRIAESLEHDFDNLGALVKTFGAAGQRFDVRKHFEEVRKDFLAEADYRNEAANARAFGKAVAPLDALHVPKPYEALTAQRVLTLEYIHGPTLKEAMEQPLDDDERFELGRLLVLATFWPFLSARMMHVDPHPGNFLLLEDGRLGVLDFGNVKRFTPEFVAVSRQMLRYMTLGEKADVVALTHQAGFEVQLPDAEVKELVDGIVDIIRRPMAEPTWDFAKDDARERLRTLGLKNATRFMKMKPPKHSPLYYRAIGGMWLNLVALKVSGPMHEVFVELVSASPRA
jgi:predicted unusual protein kinase regulating ubiquinone biosynthesis (AarF/ABC1/UbiB family)